MSITWNPWHGCRKVSEGCQNCYVYRIDGKHGKSGADISINQDFLLPLLKSGEEWKIPPGETVFTCFSSDFLLEEADEWREDVWKMMKTRKDLHFIFFTKRIERLASVFPSDWGQGYPNVTIGCTCENQERADFRLPIFINLPICERMIICAPLLGEISVAKYIAEGKIASVTAGGESGEEARLCKFAWVEKLQAECKAAGVHFYYHQTGALLERDGKIYRIPRKYQLRQAKKANMDL